MTVANCLKKYIVKPTEFPPPCPGSLGRTVMDSKPLWINKKSFFLLQSSSWNLPMLFFTEQQMLKGAKCPWSVLELVSFPELYTWLWLLGSLGACWRGWHEAVAPAANMPLLEAVLLLLTPPIPEGAREASTYHDYWGSTTSELWAHTLRSTVERAQAVATNTGVRRVAMTRWPGGRGQGVWRRGHPEVTPGFQPQFHCSLVVRFQTNYSTEPHFSFYEMRMKIQNCQDLIRECIRSAVKSVQSSVLWFWSVVLFSSIFFCLELQTRKRERGEKLEKN